MEDNILKSTKKILRVPPDYEAYDHDILVGINSAFASLNQLGVTPSNLSIVDDGGSWDALALSASMMNLVQAYVYLKARKFFDPPATSFHIQAINEQITEHEFRISVLRDEESAAANV
jgi:FMN phosphatase YigB (HAD superfamily)